MTIFHRNLKLFLLIFLLGCSTPQQNIEKYDAYWGSINDNPELGPIGATGWCSQKPIPEWDFNFKDCENAPPERIIEGAMCPNK